MDTGIKNLIEAFRAEKERIKKEIENMKFPEADNGIVFSRMEKLFVYRLKENHYYANWSGKETGKTTGWILASRTLDCHLTVVIGEDPLLEERIRELYGDSVIINYDGTLPEPDPTKYTYILFNPSGKHKAKKFFGLLENFKVDYLVFDNFPGKKSKTFQTYRNHLTEKDDCLVTVVLANPYSQKDKDAFSLLTLLSGEDYDRYTRLKEFPRGLALESAVCGCGIFSQVDPRKNMKSTEKE